MKIGRLYEPSTKSILCCVVLDVLFGFVNGTSLSVSEGDEQLQSLCVRVVSNTVLEMSRQVEIQHVDTEGITV